MSGDWEAASRASLFSPRPDTGHYCEVGAVIFTRPHVVGQSGGHAGGLAAALAERSLQQRGQAGRGARLQVRIINCV